MILSMLYFRHNEFIFSLTETEVMIKKIKEFLGLAFYTSKLDQFLEELNKKYHKHSDSQAAESKKYQRISTLRDRATSDATQPSLWDKF